MARASISLMTRFGMAGRPRCWPRASAARMPAVTRSLMSEDSSSAIAPMMVNIARACHKVFGVYGSLSLRAAYAPPDRRWPMILNALAEKLKRRSKDGFKGRHFEATLILQAVSWYLRYALTYRDIGD